MKSVALQMMRMATGVAILAACGLCSCRSMPVSGRIKVATASNESITLRCVLDKKEAGKLSLTATITNIGWNDILIDHDLVCFLDVHLFDKDDRIMKTTFGPDGSLPVLPDSFKTLPRQQSVSRTIEFPGLERFLTVSKKLGADLRVTDFFVYRTSMRMPDPSQI
jgi:hypothetical protein